MLYDGRAVLTAAHLFDFSGSSATFFFNTTASAIAGTGNQVAIHPSYDPFNGNNDLALVWLNSPAFLPAERYTLYRDSDEIGGTMTLAVAGYGTPGTGQYGTDDDYSGPLLRLKAKNTFDANAAQLKSSLGAALGWSPLLGSPLIADFDNGTFANDALGPASGHTAKYRYSPSVFLDDSSQTAGVTPAQTRTFLTSAKDPTVMLTG